MKHLSLIIAGLTAASGVANAGNICPSMRKKHRKPRIEIRECIEEKLPHNEIITSIKVYDYFIVVRSKNGSATIKTYVKNVDEFMKKNDNFIIQYIEKNEFYQENIKYILDQNTSLMNSKAMEYLKQLLFPEID